MYYFITQKREKFRNFEPFVNRLAFSKIVVNFTIYLYLFVLTCILISDDIMYGNKGIYNHSAIYSFGSGLSFSEPFTHWSL